MAKKATNKPKQLPQMVYASIPNSDLGFGNNPTVHHIADMVEPQPFDSDASGRLIGVYELVRTYIASVRVDRDYSLMTK